MAERPSGPFRVRFPLMALGLLGLLAAMWAGLVRLGWALPPLSPRLPPAHGPLMVGGFLGTLICLERAVALERLGHRFGYAAPFLTALGTLVLLGGVPGPPAPALIMLGSLGLVVVFVFLMRLQSTLFTFALGLGALAWLVGNGLWLLGRPVYEAVLWWAGFLGLTIAGERLELGRLRHPSHPAPGVFLAAVGVFLGGLFLSLTHFDAGMRLLGLGMLGLAGWLLRYDVARRTVRQGGLTRFVAVCLLSGYLWLGVSGLAALLFGGVAAGPRYDAVWHAFFLGFVFSMIFGHAPVILPAVGRVHLPFHRGFYAHWALLQLSLLLRVVGDLAFWPGLRRWGGLLNVAALLLFLLVTAATALKARASKPEGKAGGR